MKAQREAAAEGKERLIVTGDKTKLSESVLNSGSKIEHRDDIGSL